MSVRYQQSESTEIEKWVTVPLERGASLDVLVRRPSFDDRNKSRALIVAGHYTSPDAHQEGAVTHRIKTAIVDWREVTDANDKAIKFSFDALKALCVEFPSLYDKLVDIASEAYRTISEDEEKNSDDSPSDSSAANAANATAS